MCNYGQPEQEKWFREAWAKTGKKLDMGKSSVRIKKLGDVALDVIGEAIRRSPAKAYIQHYESVIRPPEKKKAPGAEKSKPAAMRPLLALRRCRASSALRGWTGRRY